MNRTCNILLLLFCAVVSGRKLHESPEKCAGPFDVSNTILHRTGGIGTGRDCDTFRGKELPMDEALGLLVRLASPPTSNASLFDLQKEMIETTLAPSKACLLENWEGHGRRALLREPCYDDGFCVESESLESTEGAVTSIAVDGGPSSQGPTPSTQGSNFSGTFFARFPFFARRSGGFFGQGLGRRRRQLMIMTTQGEEGEEGEDAPGPASDGLGTGEVGDGEAAFAACNGRCCALLLVKEKDLNAAFEASAN